MILGSVDLVFRPTQLLFDVGINVIGSTTQGRSHQLIR
jgi:hypothetical protein